MPSLKRGRTSRASMRKKLKRAQPKQILKSSGELKGLDVVLTLTPVINTTGTNGSAFLLNGVDAGNGSTNRIGRKVHPKYFWIKGTANYQYRIASTTNNVVTSPLRMVVVWDKQPSSTSIPTFEEIFGISNSGGTETSHVFAPRRFDNMDRFTVLKDKMYTVDINATPPLGGSENEVLQSIILDEYITVPKSYETVYSGTGSADITNISSGACYVYFRTEANAVTSHWAVSSSTSSRYRFTD